MGPAYRGGAHDRSSAVPRKPNEAPPLYPGADRFRWRRQVSAWVSYIQRRADAGDKTCKSHAATLSDLLYASVHPSYQKVLELAKSASLDFSVPTEKQPDVVQDIVRLIGYETPIEATSRLLTAYKAVHACIRYPSETLDRFTVRYRGVASNYMDLANVSCNSQDSQLLALVLLENAQLTPDTLQGAKLQLVQQAQQRVTGSNDQTQPAHKQCIDKCTQMLSTLSVAVPESIPESEETVGDPVTMTRLQYMELISCFSDIKTILNAKTPGYDQDAVSDRPHPIFLDDAVLVLQTMTSPVTARAPIQTQPDAPTPVFLASNKSPKTPTSNTTACPSLTQPADVDSFNSLKKRTRCHACNRYGHWKGDPSCAKKKLRRTNDESRSHPQQQNDTNTSNGGDAQKGF
jgi:hypothetical protein